MNSKGNILAKFFWGLAYHVVSVLVFAGLLYYVQVLRAGVSHIFPSNFPDSAQSLIGGLFLAAIKALLEFLLKTFKDWAIPEQIDFPQSGPLPESDTAILSTSKLESLIHELSDWRSECLNWRRYGDEMKQYDEKMRGVIDKLNERQLLLRASIVGIVILSIFLSFAAFMAPLGGATAPQMPVQPNIFFSHLALLLVGFLFAGPLGGITVCYLAANRNMARAFRYSFISSSVLGASATMVSLPYVFHALSNVYDLHGIGLPAFVWLMLVRMIVGPLFFATFGGLTCGIVARFNLFSRQVPNSITGQAEMALS